MKFSVWPTLSIMQKSCALKKEPWSYAQVKMLYSFFLSIYPWCGTLALLATRHTTMCLDFAPEHVPQLSVTEKYSDRTLYFQPCPAHYTVLQMKNNMRSISEINSVTTKSYQYKYESQYVQGSHDALLQINTAKLNVQRRANIMHALYIMQYVKRYLLG